jgi:hypothetical protein
VNDYFRVVFAGFPEIGNLQYRRVALPGWTPEYGKCHENAEYWAARNAHCEVVRGWLFSNEFIADAHSVVYDRNAGELVDITPIHNFPDLRRFVPHPGTEEEFALLKVRHAQYINV